MTTGEFDGLPFVAGSITGLRVFDVDQHGRLVSPVKHEVFRPGENVAECLGGKSGPHQVAGLSCSCGFYAYLGAAPYSVSASAEVEALISGYGTVTVGSRGFRAQKASLVALIEPRQSYGRRLAYRFLRWLREREALLGLAILLALGIAGVGALAAVANLVLVVFFGHSSLWWLTVAGVLVGIAGVWALVTLVCVVDAGEPVSAKEWDLRLAAMRRNYPGVPVYASRKQALAAHPLSLPPDRGVASGVDVWSLPVA